MYVGLHYKVSDCEVTYKKSRVEIEFYIKRRQRQEQAKTRASGGNIGRMGKKGVVGEISCYYW